MRTFFDVIGQYLVQDKIVKVKGFGTFKLVDVQERESVDVNTGERIVIKGHIKVTFTPETSLRDQVNKPFVDFETVIINEGTDLKFMENMDGAEEMPETDEALLPLEEEEKPLPLEEAPAEDTEKESMSIPVQEEQPVEEEDMEEPEEEIQVQEQVSEPVSETVKDIQPKPEAVQVQEYKKVQPEPEAIVADNVPGNSDVDEKKSTFRTVVWMLLTLVLMLMSYYAGYYRVLCPCQKVQHPVVAKAPVQKQKTNVTPEQITPVMKDTAAVVEKQGRPDTIPTPVKPSKPSVSAQQIERYPQVPGGKYLIVGLKRTHKMMAGDNLYKISRKYYGHYDGVKYIIAFNNFSNPDVIPPGYRIKIPVLKKVP